MLESLITQLALKHGVDKHTLEWYRFPNISENGYPLEGHILYFRFPNGELKKLLDGKWSEWNGEFPKLSEIKDVK
ncbi:hypothetical protein N9043_00290 [bacterium]|nr:hypothetical protein [bacterium]